MPRDNYVRVRRFGISSVAKIAAIFGVAVGVIALVVSMIVGASGVAPGFSAGLGIGIGLVVLVAAIVCLALCGAIEAFLYNVIIKIVGSLRMVLQKDVIRKVDPLSYAKISFVFSFIVYGILALFVGSVLLSAVGIGSGLGSVPVSLLAAVFVFALVVYGFILPYIWASLYNWLADRIGGIGIVLRKGVLEKIDIWSYVKMVLALSVIVFVVERVIGAVVGAVVRTPQPGGVLAFVAGFVAVIVVSLVGEALVAWFYNLVAKRFGGLEIDVGK